MMTAGRDLAATDIWERSLERSRRRRMLLVQARRDVGRRKRVSAAMATAMLASSGAPLALAGTAGAARQEIASASPANRAIEVKEGGLPLRIGSHGDLVAHVQHALGIDADGVYGPVTEAAVRRYQYAARLAVDGIVGPLTWSSLFASGSGQATGVGGDVPQGVKAALAQTLEGAGASSTAAEPARDGATRPVADIGAPSTDERAAGTAGEGSTDGGSPGNESQPGGGDSGQADTPTPTGNGRSLPGTKVGGSCGSATIAAPVKGVQTSPYGMRWGRMHEGVDLGAASGTPVHAAACGTVTVRGQQSGYGNIVCITHTSSFATCYAHLSGFAVANGQQVKVGQTIGYVGCTGNCTGPHLHFETRVNGQAQDPRRYLAGASIPGKASAAAAKASAPAAKTTTVASGHAASVKQANAAWSSAGGGAANGSSLSTTKAASIPAPAAPATTSVAATPPPAQDVVTAAPAPVEAAPVQAAPAPTAAAPVEVAPAPVQTAPATPPAPVQAAPVPVETAPAPVETAPVETTPAPAPVETAPMPVEATPPTTEAAPTQAAPSPSETAPAPVEAAAAPTQAAPTPAP